VDPCHFHAQCCERPDQSGRPAEPEERLKGSRQRLCLLKGCEQPFWPKCPQARYCSEACQQAAERWRKYRSSRTYRGSDQGREKRREQARQHRQRRRAQLLVPTAVAAPAVAASPPAASTSAEAVSTSAEPVPVAASMESTASVTAAAPGASAAELASCVGQRPALGCEDFVCRRCVRPGCYAWFPVKHDPSSKRFCSVACRLALRRVLDREARYLERRRHGRRERLTSRGGPLDSS
jgi:hypothetical protein